MKLITHRHTVGNVTKNINLVVKVRAKRVSLQFAEYSGQKDANGNQEQIWSQVDLNIHSLKKISEILAASEDLFHAILLNNGTHEEQIDFLSEYMNLEELNGFCSEITENTPVEKAAERYEKTRLEK